MNTRRTLLKALAITLPVAALTGCESLPKLGGGNADITGALTKQLGVTDSQAKGGVGSVLALAKEKLGGADFDKIAKVIPGADKYLKAATDLGAVTGKLGDLKGLSGALGKLGMSPDQITKFPPAVTEQVGKLGGGDLKNLLGGVLK
ncbi:MAG: DUF2780 domain-containing protein [Burkholderiales bacterium]